MSLVKDLCFILNGIINVNMSTIEKRFGLTSSQAGWIASVHDITAAPVALFVSFIGAVGYKMRWIGFGLFCLSIGSFIIIMPHFAAGEYKWQHNFTGLCSRIIAVPGGAGGQLLGGYICKRFGLKINQMTRLAIVCFVVSLTTWSVVWIKCDGSVLADITEKHDNRRYQLNFSHLDFTAACNIDCYCTTAFYQPICGSNKQLYFSPCHAGCVEHNVNNQSYSNCSCIDDIEQPGYATKGMCKNHGNCYQLFIFLPLLMITFFLTFVARTPLVAVVLRCIPDNQKTFGLGVNHFIRRLVVTASQQFSSVVVITTEDIHHL
ncbi:solute carrier organic anion transporter family member 4C1 isoform X3 [Octopus vulgaris]|uniref:Solute carrier organic anion transporter family member 4C1 isoform X3 n=1 Tax=Octopus vulgaris TaxID=6645 RepID=A0AA36F271_OCTVU|nr:solute carrier organic anion transporter family member 4C1 isoform X3 [Octopus vulgaris]